MKKLQLKKNIVAQLSKSQLDQVVGGSASAVTNEVRQTEKDTSLGCMSGPCHTSQITNCDCATRANCISDAICKP